MTDVKVTKTEVARYWSTDGPKRWQNGPVVADVGEPSCFACGWYAKEWDKSSRPWEAAKSLEMAHIVASSIGGANTPDNLVILCVACHEEAPMTNDREIMFRWIAKREGHLVRELKAWLRELEVQGISQGELAALDRLRTSGCVDGRYAKALQSLDAGFHFSRLGRGPIMTTSTRVAVVAQLVRDLKVEGLL